MEQANRAIETGTRNSVHEPGTPTRWKISRALQAIFLVCALAAAPVGCGEEVEEEQEQGEEEEDD